MKQRKRKDIDAPRKKVNQEWSNLSKREKRGLNKLRKRINRGEIVVLKSDKSGRILAMRKEEYLDMGKKSNIKDKKLNRKEIREIERNINDHTRMLCKILPL